MRGNFFGADFIFSMKMTARMSGKSGNFQLLVVCRLCLKGREKTDNKTRTIFIGATVIVTLWNYIMKRKAING